MPNWRKLIYSGSDASLANITAITVSGSFSGSYVGDGSGLTGVVATIPSGIVSSSAQFRTITSPFTGSFTGSFKGDGSGILNVISASYAANGGGSAATYAITGSSMITATVNNWNPAGIYSVNTIKVACNHIYGINGIVSQSAARELTLINTGSYSFYVSGNHPSSSASNQIESYEDIIIQPKQSIGLCYDTTMAKWLISHYPNCNTHKIISTHGSPGSVTAGDAGHIGFAVLGSGANTNSSTMLDSVGSSWRLATGTSVPGAAMIFINKNTGFTGYTGFHHISGEATIGLENLSTAAQEYGIEVGLNNSSTAVADLAANSSCGIRYTNASSSGNFEGFSIAGAGGKTIINLGISVAANTAYVLRTEVNKELEARFYVNGTLCGIIPKVNLFTIPQNAAVSTRAIIAKTVGTTNRFMHVSQIYTRAVLH